MPNKTAYKKELAEILGVKIRQIGNYIKQGMPIHSTGKRNAQIFDIEACRKWQHKSVNKEFSSKTLTPAKVDKLIEVTKGSQEENQEDENVDQQNDMLRKLKADADRAETESDLAKVKLSVQRGMLVDANDLDRAMSELAIVHKTDKIHDENLLPVILENKNAGEIKLLLQEHNHDRLAMLDKIINKEFESNETLYEIVEAILHQLKKGIEPDSLIKRINGRLL
jgi:phage terminase Nu1 subunit (DNA packaging protein)